jgi:hypothetical protein
MEGLQWTGWKPKFVAQQTDVVCAVEVWCIRSGSPLRAWAASGAKLTARASTGSSFVETDI